MTRQFANESFFQALDIFRQSRGLNWKKAAEEAKVSASTFTRIAQGKKPDVDTLSALCSWANLDANAFLKPNINNPDAEPMHEALALFRADPRLSEQGRRAVEALVQEAYKQFRAS